MPPSQAPSDADVRARIRIDENPVRLARRLEAGEIAVIDRPDLDRATARLLIDAQPTAILNASASSTGRYPNLGPALVLKAGILLLDDLGSDIMTLREGDTITISGTEVTQDGRLIASGHVMTDEDDLRAREEARLGLSTQIEAFDEFTDDYFERESDLLYHEKGIPTLRAKMQGRPVLLVNKAEDSVKELKGLRRWIRDTNPILVGVDGGADLLLRERMKPHIIVADMDAVSEKALGCGAELVVRENRDGTAPGRERLNRQGRSYEVMTASGTSEDAAIILAATQRASVIATIGIHLTLQDFLDRGRAGMASTFFTRLKAGDALISSRAIRETYRPRISAFWLIVFVIVAVLLAGAALWSTPWGQGAMDVVAHWVASWWPFSAGSS